MLGAAGLYPINVLLVETLFPFSQQPSVTSEKAPVRKATESGRHSEEGNGAR